MIEDLTASSYGGGGIGVGESDNEGSGQRSQSSQTLNLKLSILQTDLSRTQYLIRSFLRQRLAKITRFSMHYLLLISPDKNAGGGGGGGASQSQTTTTTTTTGTTGGDDSQLPRSSSLLSSTDNMDVDMGTDSREHRNAIARSTAPLSPDEARFLQAHHSLLYSHYNASFLSTFPPKLRRLDDNAGGTNMVEGPDTKEIVFVRCLAEEVTIVIPPDDVLNEETYGTTMKMGEIWAVRWEGVKKAWERGEVEVL